jgi:hypothetical protein
MYIFGAAGRYLLFTHILIFIMLIVLIERLEAVMPIRKFDVLFLVFLVIWSSGLSADFHLKSKASPTFQEDWRNFSECIDASKTDCVVSIPPGGIWGFNK